jgi:hypothetical protein
LKGNKSLWPTAAIIQDILNEEALQDDSDSEDEDEILEE